MFPKIVILIQFFFLWFFFSMVLFQTEHSSRSERKRRDSFGMFDGYDSCSEDTSSSSSSDESEEEVAPLPSSLPIIKNNGQVYTYPDGKSGMGEYTAFQVFSFWIFSPVALR